MCLRIRVVLSILALSIPHAASALVNPLDQSLSEIHEDYAGKSLALIRNFHSARTVAGIFGKGWCSVWETKLKRETNSASFNYCGDGKVVRFKKQLKWTSDNPYYHFIEQNDGAMVQVGFRNQYVFDKVGRLVSMKLGNQQTKLDYGGEKLKKVQTPQEKLEFFYGADGKLEKVATTGGKEIRYKFQKDYLKSVESGKIVLFRYEHNAHGQLEKVAVGDKTRSYDYKGKGVARIKFENCVETLNKNGGVIAAEKNCDGRREVKSYAVTGVSRATSITVKETKGKEVRERTWEQGRLKTDRSPASNAKFEYDKDGFVKEMSVNGWRLKVEQRIAGVPQRVSILPAGEKKADVVSLQWSQGSLTAVKSKTLKFTISERDGQTSFTGLSFKLVKAGNKVSGQWMGEKIAPFEMGLDLKAYSNPQLEALATLGSLVAMKERVESL